MVAECADPAYAPRLTLLDSIPLEESDSLYLGRPAAMFHAAPSGQLYVPDAGNNRLVVYSPDGRIDRVIGGPGRGPGEFTAIGFATLAVGNEVWQDDYQRRRVTRFGPDEAPPREAVYQGRLSSLQQTGGWIWAGVTNHDAKKGIAKLSIDGAVDSIHAVLVALPSEYEQYPLLRYWDTIMMAVSADTMLVGFGGVQYFVRYDTSGTPRDTVTVPVCSRQGSPQDILERGFSRPASNAREQAEQTELQARISALHGLWRLQDGTYLIWHQDPQRDPDGIPRALGYLTVLSPDLSRACVDAPLPAPGSGRTILTAANGEILLLDQVVQDSPNRPSVRTVVRRFRISTEGCRWSETGRSVGSPAP